MATPWTHLASAPTLNNAAVPCIDDVHDGDGARGHMRVPVGVRADTPHHASTHRPSETVPRRERDLCRLNGCASRPVIHGIPWWVPAGEGAPSPVEWCRVSAAGGGTGAQ